MKNFEIKNQNGRSMIEMLGVLAIIGVLSVGGIAGYSKAMMKYRINKTIEQITLIAGNVRAFWGQQKNYEDLQCEQNCSSDGCHGYNESCNVAKKAKIFPDEMLTITDGKITNIENAFGGHVSIDYFDKSASGDNRAFYIEYTNIPQEACIELLTQDWTNANILGVSVGDGGTPKGLTPVDIARATNACYDDVTISFYGDIDPAFFVKDLPSHYQL